MASCTGNPGRTRLTRLFQFVVLQRHRGTALDGCHREAAHQGQGRSAALMQECFWWPGMTRDLRSRIKKCGSCRKYEAAPPVTPMKPLACSGPGELLHVDFTSIEETVPLKEDPVIRNVLVLQDHFSKYVVTYVVKDQTARTAAETLRIGYFRLFGTPAYLVNDQGKAFTGHVITHLCELYGVQKLRTSPYHAQTNCQVKRMNQMIIRMIGKLEEDRKACWSEHLPELLMAYNATCSAVTGYSPYYLLFGRRPRIPVDYLFPTLRDSPHQTKMEVSVAAMQKRLKEAFAVARRLTSEEVARQCHYYDCKAGAVALQPGDVVMVRTDGFVGKWKVKDRLEVRVSLLSLSWRTGLSTRSNVRLLMTGRNPNTGFSIGTAYCLSPMRVPLASQVKHRPRRPQLSQMPPQRLFQKEQVC